MANELSSLLKAVIEVRRTARVFESKLEKYPQKSHEIIPDYHARLKEKMQLLSRARRKYNQTIKTTQS